MSDNDIVKNTFADIWEPDNHTFHDVETGKVKEFNYGAVVESIATPLWGNVKYTGEDGSVLIEGEYFLDTYLQKMPHGIVDKKRPGDYRGNGKFSRYYDYSRTR